MSIIIPCSVFTWPAFKLDRRRKSVSVCPFWLESVKLTKLRLRRCRSPLPTKKKKNKKSPRAFFPLSNSVQKQAMASSVTCRCFSEGFKRFWWLKYSPSTRFLPSPTAQSEAGLSVLGGTKMATQRLGWIRLRSRTPPRLRHQRFVISRTTNQLVLLSNYILQWEE